MKALFKAIRDKEFDKVKALIEKDPQLVHATAKEPPKMDDGQSPLQVALKTSNFEIVTFLLDHGADPNFMEKSAINPWNIPATHDAIMASIASCSLLRAKRDPILRKETADKAFANLKKMIEKGANLQLRDSYGNGCMARAVMDASKLTVEEDAIDEINDVKRVFEYLVSQGGDLQEQQIHNGRLGDWYGPRPVGRYFRHLL